MIDVSHTRLLRTCMLGPVAFAALDAEKAKGRTITEALQGWVRAWLKAGAPLVRDPGGKMVRQLSMPQELWDELEAKADRCGISYAEAIRQAIEFGRPKPAGCAP